MEISEEKENEIAVKVSDTLKEILRSKGAVSLSGQTKIVKEIIKKEIENLCQT